ncbi:MAG: uracil-DNA glycosylase family protein [Kiritimatiellae bacterium]|nr:uracil-DNA glycosylase family protein [Kiritimatiellia bacterium]
METERHPFDPFLPPEARVLFLGTFPAKPHRWSMRFYYPNFLNDFWRIMGLVFFGDAKHFESRGAKAWDEEAIRAFCAGKALAFSDTAEEIRRLKGNASDAALEVVRPRDVDGLLVHLPRCRAIATTGGKAAEVVAGLYGVEPPVVGGFVPVRVGDGRVPAFWRLPSTSRAYPLPLEKKAAAYRAFFSALGIRN